MITLIKSSPGIPSSVTVNGNTYAVTNTAGVGSISANEIDVPALIAQGWQYNSVANAVAATNATTAPSIGITGGAARVLGVKIGANLNSVADQIIAINATKYIVTGIYASNASAAALLAAGGIYSAAAKGGEALVAAAQAYAALVVAADLLPLVLANPALLKMRTEANLYLALTTAAGAPVTADLYVVGIALTP